MAFGKYVIRDRGAETSTYYCPQPKLLCDSLPNFADSVYANYLESDMLHMTAGYARIKQKIISGTNEHGLIFWDTKIQDYHRRMKLTMVNVCQNADVSDI